MTYSTLIINELKDSQKVLKAFLENEKNIEAIEKAGKLMADAINDGVRYSLVAMVDHIAMPCILRKN